MKRLILSESLRFYDFFQILPIAIERIKINLNDGKIVLERHADDKYTRTFTSVAKNFVKCNILILINHRVIISNPIRRKSMP